MSNWPSAKSTWLDIGLVHFYIFQDRDEVEVNKIVFLHIDVNVNIDEILEESLQKITPNLDIFFIPALSVE